MSKLKSVHSASFRVLVRDDREPVARDLVADGETMWRSLREITIQALERALEDGDASIDIDIILLPEQSP